MWREKTGGIHDNHSTDLVEMFQCPGQTDHSSPIVHNQRDRSVQVDVAHQGLQIVDAALQSKVVSAARWFVRQTASHVVRCDNTVAGTERLDQGSEKKRPGRVAVYHQDWIALAFIDIVIFQSIAIQIVGLVGVKVPKASAVDG